MVRKAHLALAALSLALACAGGVGAKGFKHPKIAPEIFEAKQYSSPAIASKVQACARMAARDSDCAFVEYGDESSNTPDGRVYVACRKPAGGFIRYYCKYGEIVEKR